MISASINVQLNGDFNCIGGSISAYIYFFSFVLVLSLEQEIGPAISDGKKK